MWSKGRAVGADTPQTMRPPSREAPRHALIRLIGIISGECEAKRRFSREQSWGG